MSVRECGLLGHGWALFRVAICAQFANLKLMPHSDTENEHSRFTIDLRAPRQSDGAAMWRLTRDTGVLDLNSSYQYLLWCRDFSATSVVAVSDHDQQLMGYITGFMRPDDPAVLMIWQVAVDDAARGHGLASRMLDFLVETTSAQSLETTVTDDNAASNRLFASLAERHGANHDITALFTPDMYPDNHDTEYLHSIGPLTPTSEQKSPKTTLEGNHMDTSIFETTESEVRSYSRGWPTVFTKASGSIMTDEQGKDYIDFFAGAGALNYGHNNPELRSELVEYMTSDALVHSLDMMTPAKRDFLQTFKDLILEPRDLDYKVMFPGPTGTNTVEAALKLARKVTGRQHILSFTNAFHGMTLGSLSVTGNSMKRKGAGMALTNSSKIPFDDYLDGATTDFLWLERVLEDSGSGVDKPAAIIVETVQGEGGLNAARTEWLRGLRELTARHDILLIVDDVQAGCGRTGTFFSFEEAGITPDIVCVSKSISGYGLPMALTLFKPELDVWAPGEHNGTFRGNNPAFVTATAALRRYWADDSFQKGHLTQVIDTIQDALTKIAIEVEGTTVKGRGLLTGLSFQDSDVAGKVAGKGFEKGLLMETSGPKDEVLKLMPAMTIELDVLERGLRILADVVSDVTGQEITLVLGETANV